MLNENFIIVSYPEEKGTLPNSFYEAKVIQRHHKKGKLQTNIPYEYRCKSPQQNTSKPNPAAN